MPAGCEFICKNKDCQHFNCGFSMVDAWPITRIELIIEQNQVKKDEPFRKKIIDMKNNGRKYFKIQYPNDNHVPKLGYSLNKWCSKCLIVWDFEALGEKDEDTLENCLKKSNIIENCSKCETKLIEFIDVIKEGIKCPICQKTMEQSRWFTNEK